MMSRAEAERFLGAECHWCQKPIGTLATLSLISDRGKEPWRPYHRWCAEEEAEMAMDRLLRGRGRT
jgi:hypothetical protein